MGQRPGPAAKEAGKRATETRRRRYGPDYYQKIGSLGGNATLARYGIDHFREMGEHGGATTMECYGSSHYAALGEQSATMKKQRKEQGT